MILAVGSDHAGYELKEELKPFILSLGNEIVDAGCSGLETVDYPVIAEQVALMVRRGEAGLGILICGSGQGMAIVANKIPGIRAVVCNDEFSAKVAREHNDANLLAFGARLVGKDQAEGIIKQFLSASFAGGRHQRRVDMISEIEEKYLIQRGAIGGLY
ncbi:MAG: ribose 5-phosphate isomerase B [Syntrophomonadaceae bacterium]|nr:ribose 5-phosphate isomerase B [Syntrophomonadaceae bacterium]